MDRIDAVAKVIWDCLGYRYISPGHSPSWGRVTREQQFEEIREDLRGCAQRIIEIDANYNRPF